MSAFIQVKVDTMFVLLISDTGFPFSMLFPSQLSVMAEENLNGI